MEQVQNIKFGEFQGDMKYLGIHRVLGSLKADGIHVDTKRVAKVMKQLDPEGAIERGKRFIPHEKIRRGKYQAPGVAHAMHSDVNEKLKRYKLYLSVILFITL